jgi:hypothetical protein
MPISQIVTNSIAVGAVATVDIADLAVTPAKLSAGAPSWNGSGILSFNSGYGSTAVAYGCRAWVNFNGTGTVAIRASGNVSSITDNGAADYTVNFTTAMPDTSYAVTGSAEYAGGAGGAVTPFADYGGTYTTTQVRIAIRALDFGFYDRPIVGVAIFR